MEEINIKGVDFTREEVLDYGKKSIKRSRKILFSIGVTLAAIAILYAAIFLPMPASTSVDPDTGETIVMTRGDNIALGISMLVCFGTPGAILIIKSYKKENSDPYDAGITYLNKHFPYPLGFDGQVANILHGDRTIKLSKSGDPCETKIVISSFDNSFQIIQNKTYSKIFTSNDVLGYEVRVDNDVVINSQTTSKTGMGKALVGGALFGGAGMVAGAIAGNTKSATSQTQTAIHHYTFILRVNDIMKPTIVVELPSLQIAEEIVTTFELICNSQKVVVENQPLTVKESSQNQIANTNDAEKPNKFEELKKFKELLDMGIITQEEFDNEKKKILG